MLRQYKVFAHALVTRGDASRILTFITVGNGAGSFESLQERLAYYEKMQTTYGNSIVREMPTGLVYELYFFNPYRPEEVTTFGYTNPFFAIVRGKTQNVARLVFSELVLCPGAIPEVDKTPATSPVLAASKPAPKASSNLQRRNLIAARFKSRLF